MIRFAVVSENVLEELKVIEVEKYFVSEEMVKKISELLELETTPANDLRAVRNTVVKELSGSRDWDMSTRISMITAVIDNKMINQGIMP